MKDSRPITGKGYRLKNRRVEIYPLEDYWMIVFKRLGEGKREIIKTKVKLSDEALGALAWLYLNYETAGDR